MSNSKTNRRSFIKYSALVTGGLMAQPFISSGSSLLTPEEEGLYIIGPKKGYTPQVGTLLSTMTMMRSWVLDTVKDLSQEELDFQIDDKSNSIGAMLMHLAATERYYQLNTFDEMEWGSWSDEIKAEWEVASGLGEVGREQIKGHDAGYYLKKLENVREITHKGFAERDDEWLMKTEPFFGNEPTNNHCKWFHVCEHESNHRGQMKFILKRLPTS